MARKLVCDVCAAEAPDTPEEKKEWTHLELAKLENHASVISRDELCPGCTSTIRHVLQAGKA